MSKRYVIVGADTGVGKTVFSAALVAALDGFYWKPVQAGLADETDSQCVARLSGIAPERILPEAYRLRTPASPHHAARLDGLEIEAARLAPLDVPGALLIETAGGVLTPLTLAMTNADLLAFWRLPAIIVARTSLGAINHALLTLEALRRRGVFVHGIAFCGEENAETQATICGMGATRQLGRLPKVTPLTRENLHAAFAGAFDLANFV